MVNKYFSYNREFRIDTVNSVVFCILHCYVHFDMENEIRRKFLQFGDFVVKAKAKCHANDSFDLEKGKSIAESRAIAKAYSLVIKSLNSICEYYLNKSNEFENIKNNFELEESKEKLRIFELTNL